MAGPIAVNSSWVKAITYQGGLLAVTTIKGKLITYIQVPERVWEQLQAASSKGEFINKHIKGVYKSL